MYYGEDSGIGLTAAAEQEGVNAIYHDIDHEVSGL